jgi:hypothetical protein
MMKHLVSDLLLLGLKKLQLDLVLFALSATVYALHDGSAALPFLVLSGVLLLRFAVWVPIFYRMWMAREGS